MIFTTSWNRRRLRKQILRQQHRGKSKFSRILFVIAALSLLYILYAQFITKDNGILDSNNNSVVSIPTSR